MHIKYATAAKKYKLVLLHSWVKIFCQLPKFFECAPGMHCTCTYICVCICICIGIPCRKWDELDWIELDTLIHEFMKKDEGRSLEYGGLLNNVLAHLVWFSACLSVCLFVLSPHWLNSGFRILSECEHSHSLDHKPNSTEQNQQTKSCPSLPTYKWCKLSRSPFPFLFLLHWLGNCTLYMRFFTLFTLTFILRYSPIMFMIMTRIN